MDKRLALVEALLELAKKFKAARIRVSDDEIEIDMLGPEKVIKDLVGFDASPSNNSALDEE